MIGRSGGIETRPGSDAYQDLGATYRLYTTVAIEPWTPLDPPAGSDSGVGNNNNTLVVVSSPTVTVPPVILNITPPPPPLPVPVSRITIYKYSPGNGTTVNLPVTLSWAQDAPSATGDGVEYLYPVSYVWAIATNAGMSAIVAQGSVGAPALSAAPAGLSEGVVYYWQVVALYEDGSTREANGGTVYAFTTGAVSPCTNCSGGTGVTPAAFTLTASNVSMSVETGADASYRKVVYDWTFPGATLAQNPVSPCQWGDSEFGAAIGSVRRREYWHGDPPAPAPQLLSDVTTPLGATLYRDSLTTYILTMEALGGGDNLYLGSATTTGCIAAVCSGTLRDPQTIEVVVNPFTVTVTPA